MAIFAIVCLSILLLMIIGINDFCFFDSFNTDLISFSFKGIRFDKSYRVF